MTAALGILMLDTAFERPPGDVGHPASWPFPTRIARIAGAGPQEIIRGDSDAFIDRFIAAGQGLLDEGCTALVTSCGFMARHQPRLAAALPCPVGASSLLLIPMLAASLAAGRRVGVITYDAASLTGAMFLGCGADPDTPRAGVPAGGAFRAMIEGGAPYDAAALEAEICAVATGLCDAHPEIGAIVLECTNMPPFARAVARATGRPVSDILTLGRLLLHSTDPADFRAGMRSPA